MLAMFARMLGLLDGHRIDKRKARSDRVGSTDTEYPALNPGELCLIWSQWWLEITSKVPSAIHLGKPAGGRIGIMLVRCPAFFRISVSEERRVDLGDNRFTIGNVEAVKWPEMDAFPDIR